MELPPISNELHGSFNVISNYHKQCYSCSSALTWADVIPEVKNHLITILHSILRGKDSVLLHLREGSQHTARNNCQMWKCNSLQCPDTRIGKDSGSYLKSFPLLHPEVQQLPNVRYAKEPGDQALRFLEGSQEHFQSTTDAYMFLIWANCLQCYIKLVKSKFQIKIPSVPN